MINFANEDFELPDRLDGNVLISKLMHWHSWRPCNFFSGLQYTLLRWSKSTVLWHRKIHSWHVHYTRLHMDCRF